MLIKKKKKKNWKNRAIFLDRLTVVISRIIVIIIIIIRIIINELLLNTYVYKFPIVD